MNDIKFDRDIRDAWYEVAMPSDVKARTLARIDELRQQQTNSYRTAQHTNTHCCQANAAALNPTAGMAKPKAVSVAQGRASRRRVRAFKYAASIAACLLLALVGVLGFRAATIPTAFVDIDVNPSIGLSLNRFGYVLSEEAINDDGAQLLGTLSVVGKPYEEAIAEIIESEVANGCLKADSFVSFSIITDKEAQGSQLVAMSDACIERVGCRGSSAIVDTQTRDAAREFGMGAGKYVAALELAERDPQLTVEDCTQMTMGELHDKIDSADVAKDDASGEVASELPSESTAIPQTNATGAPNEGDFFGANRYPLTQGAPSASSGSSSSNGASSGSEPSGDEPQGNPDNPVEADPGDHPAEDPAESPAEDPEEGSSDSGDFNFLK